MPKPIRAERSAKTPTKTGFVAYYRVSTDKQGESGLGLEAQREAVKRVARSAPILAEFTEIETAKKGTVLNRPQLAAAIDEAQRRGATLLIAKLDRLTRNVYFISGLMESGVDFMAADMPQANRLTVHIMAAFAEHEARAVSERTKAALAALKARGVKLGNPRWRDSLEQARLARGRQQPRASEAILEMIQRMRLEAKSLASIAQRLNALGVRTPRNGRWHGTSVRAVMRNAQAYTALPPRVAAPELQAEIARYRAEGHSLRHIARKLNAEGKTTPSGAAWHPSSVRAAAMKSTGT